MNAIETIKFEVGYFFENLADTLRYPSNDAMTAIGVIFAMVGLPLLASWLNLFPA